MKKSVFVFLIALCSVLTSCISLSGIPKEKHYIKETGNFFLLCQIAGQTE